MAVSPEKDRIEGLDILRLFAALSVVLFHYAFRGAAADNLTGVSLSALVPIAKYGYLGVDLFFVISGFVIAWSAEGRSWSKFAVARFARIYPAFLVCMTATFLLTLFFGAPHFTTSLHQWVANLFIFSPALGEPFMDGAYWSIVYELIFYGWVALLLATGIFPRHVHFALIGWLLISMLNEAVLGSGALQKLFITDHSGFFIAGVVIYLLRRGDRSPLTWMLLALSALVGIDQLMLDAEWGRVHYGITLSNIVLALCGLGAIGLVAGAVQIRRMAIPSRIVAGIGGLTYPLYLLHQHAGFILFNRLEGFMPAPVVIALTLALMIVVAWTVWCYVEPPCRRLIYRLAERPLAATARLPRLRTS